jgi:hypothetical protein
MGFFIIKINYISSSNDPNITHIRILYTLFYTLFVYSICDDMIWSMKGREFSNWSKLYNDNIINNRLYYEVQKTRLIALLS